MTIKQTKITVWEIEHSEWGFSVVRDGEELTVCATLDEARQYIKRAMLDSSAD
jgi:hypothetical protein